MKPPLPLHAVRRGFTLIELMVTLSILLVMLGLINFIFRDTQQAVSLGIETGETIGAQRGIASQIRRDFEQLVGPHQGRFPDTDDGGGFLVLTQKLVSDDGVNGNNGVLNAGEGLAIELPTNNSGANAGTTTEDRLVRSDQIGFIRNRGSDQPVAPRTSAEFTSRRVPDLNRTVDFARVWYGHALRTQANGEPPASNSFLGEEGSGNENPLDWLLARQAVFLDDTAPATAGPLSGIRATGLQVGAAVVGHTGVTIAQELANGLADYAVFGFEYDADDPRPSGSLVSGDNLTIPSGIPDPLLPAIPDSTEASQEAYESEAINVATYAARRLLANPTPSNDYETWQIAQAHAILNEGCSDFAIEFAADMYGGDGNPNQANLTGGDYAPDGQIDLDPLGNIAWYSWAGLGDPAFFPQRGPRIFPPATDYPPIAQGFAPGANASAAFVWRHDRFDAGVYSIVAAGSADRDDGWSRTTSNTGSPLQPNSAANAFCDWPYLIRIRYRLHDPKGQIASGAPLFRDDGGGVPANANNGVQDAGEPIIDSRNGIWFEQIIPVNRPLPVRVP